MLEGITKSLESDQAGTEEGAAIDEDPEDVGGSA